MSAKQLIEIIEKEQDIIPFLKKLTDTEKRELVPSLKKLHKKVFKGDIKNIENNTYGWQYDIESDEQRKLTEMACFVCFNKTDALRFLNANRLVTADFYLENIIPWYVPSWFSDIINEDVPHNLSYEKVMELHQKGLFTPSKELIVSKLVSSTWYRDQNRDIVYSFEIIEKYPETIKEHIWYFFEIPSEINWTGRWGRDESTWVSIFKNLSSEGKISKEKLLKSTINTADKGFNKTLSGWFYDLLISLNPTENELISLQNELFSALNSPHSKIVNTILKYLKTLAVHQDFDREAFLENSSILLNSETKSVVTSTLMIFEKIAKSDKKMTEIVCLKSTEALLNSDEKIQTRASKIIQKYGDSANETLQNEISMYADNLFLPSKEILKDFLIISDDFEEDENFEIEEVRLLSEENKIETFEAFDEMLFFVSQSIDNNEVYHLDLLLNYLPKLNRLVCEENVSKLEPILKRAFDLSCKDIWDINKQIGGLEVKVGRLFNDYSYYLEKKYPTALKNLTAHKEKTIEKLKNNEWSAKRNNSIIKKIPIEKEKQALLQYYRIHHFLFVKTKEILVENLEVSLLSTPTHQPCWIDPITLINRINSYETKKLIFDIYDFQIAIGRLPISEFPADILDHIKTIKNDEIKAVFEYQFGFLDLKKAKIITPELWLQSILSRNILEEITFFESFLTVSLQKERGSYDWEVEQESRTYDEWNYTTKKTEKKTYINKNLELKITYENIVDAVKNCKINSIYNHFVFVKNSFNRELRPNDDIKYLLLLPNNLSPLLSHLLFYYMTGSKTWEVDERAIITNGIRILNEIWYRSDLNETVYLFLGATFLTDVKTAREFSAELWIKANQQGTMNNELLGEILGKLEYNEYGALKRFTDLIVSNMFNISKFHNEKLLILIDTMLGEMNEKPIRNTKKLIELFAELKHQFPDYKISEKTLAIFEKWKSVKSLKSVVSF